MKYELMLLIKPLTNEDIRDKVITKVQKIIEGLKGTMKIKDPVGKRLMAYAVRDSKEGHYYREGYYLVLEVELPYGKATLLSKELKLYSDVLRFLLIKENSL